jgi:excisionase family DNA binding protein
METNCLLTVKEVARLLRLDSGTVYHMVSAGNLRLPCLRLSQRCLRFRAEDIEKFLADRVQIPEKSSIDERTRLRKGTARSRATSDK